MTDYKVLYRKYRPKNFNELIGQNNIKDILTNSIIKNKIAHAYIFTGPRGTGKTSTAKIFAKTLNCLNINNGVSCDECENCKSYNESADIIEIDAASNNGVEEIRSLRDSVKVAPYSSKYKIYIIDEVHMLSINAWNAFLKTLEEPPSHVIFILATTDINKVPQTVLSRCQRYDFSLINRQDMFNHLKNISILESINIDDDALEEIVTLSGGCLRDSLSYLDQISKLSNDINVDVIESNFGILTKTKLKLLLDCIEKSSVKDIDKIINEISSSGVTPNDFVNGFIDYLVNIIVNNQFTSFYTIDNVKTLIDKVNKMVLNFNNTVNPYILIKTELITFNYFPGNKNTSNEIISQEINVEKTISDSKMSVNKIDNNNLEEKDNITINIDEVKKMRINNSFVEASKDKKIKIINEWNNYLKDLNLNNKYNILGFLDNINIEVVSDLNILFSFDSASSSILFNSNLDLIESDFNKFNKSNFKFISLSIDEWINIKKDFIKNKDKKYEYIKEQKFIQKKDKTENIAIDIFGDDIIEME